MSRRLIEKDYKELLECVRNAKQAATLERANFDGFGDVVQEPGESVTDFVKRMVSLHHNSWIISPLGIAEEILVKNTRRD